MLYPFLWNSLYMKLKATQVFGQSNFRNCGFCEGFFTFAFSKTFSKLIACLKKSWRLLSRKFSQSCDKSNEFFLKRFKLKYFRGQYKIEKFWSFLVVLCEILPFRIWQDFLILCCGFSFYVEKNPLVFLFLCHFWRILTLNSTFL